MTKGYYKHAVQISALKHRQGPHTWRIRVWENVFSDGASGYLIALNRHPTNIGEASVEIQYWKASIRRPPNPYDLDFLDDAAWDIPWILQINREHTQTPATFDQTGLPVTVLKRLIADMRVHRFFYNSLPFF